MSQLLAFPSEEQPQFDRAASGLGPYPDETPMWFRRFVIYRDAGYKRSLRLAVAMERARLHLVKATNGPESEFPSDEKTAPLLPNVAMVKATNVPGSWKDAALRFHWKERAAAYELILIHKMSEYNLQQLALTHANKFQRICALQELVETTKKNMQKISMGLPIEQQHTVMLLYTKQLRGLLADLRLETKDLDDQELLASIEANALAHRQRALDRIPPPVKKGDEKHNVGWKEK